MTYALGSILNGFNGIRLVAKAVRVIPRPEGPDYPELDERHSYTIDDVGRIAAYDEQSLAPILCGRAILTHQVENAALGVTVQTAVRDVAINAHGNSTIEVVFVPKGRLKRQSLLIPPWHIVVTDGWDYGHGKSLQTLRYSNKVIFATMREDRRFQLNNERLAAEAEEFVRNGRTYHG